jgi:hypothetical protein
MNETPPGLLLFGGFFLLLVFVAILVMVLMYVGRTQRRARPSPQAASPAPQAASRAAPPPSSSPSAASSPLRQQAPEPAAAPPARPAEVMRVIRDPETGRVLVEVDGRHYAHIREIRDAAIGRRVLWAVAELVGFTGGLATNPQAVQGARAAAAEFDTGPGSNIGTAPSTSPPTPQAAPTSPRLSDLASASMIEPPAPQQGYSIVGFFRRGFEAPPAEPLPSSTAWIDEIDEILQRSIRQLPAPLSRPVHVASGDDGLLQIIVGIQTYRSADEVPDPQIRGLIQAAVAEWEQS